MIVSASRRTDIPAFYFDWFLNRVKDGFLYVRNPFNPDIVKKMVLNPDNVDIIVFWTKNASNAVDKLGFLDSLGFKYFFLYTITPYGKEVEPFVPDTFKAIQTFIRLSSLIGKRKVIWRYDPIIITSRYTVDFHITVFTEMADMLKNYTDRVIVSFLKLYKKIESRIMKLGIKDIDFSERVRLLKIFKSIAGSRNIELQTCAESIDFQSFGIPAGKCIDNDLISKISGSKIDYTRDRNQRKLCLCNESVDIGAYNTCRHFCLYCYANDNIKIVRRNLEKHVQSSGFLVEVPSRINNQNYNFSI